VFFSLQIQIFILNIPYFVLDKVEEKSTNSEKFCGFILPTTNDLSEARKFPPHFPDTIMRKLISILKIFQIK